MICSIDLIETGYSIRRTMQTHGICVKDIAQILNVSTQTVYKWLNGQSLPTLENVIALSSYLGVSVEELIIKKVRYEYSIPDYMVREYTSMRNSKSCLLNSNQRLSPQNHILQPPVRVKISYLQI